MGLLDIALLVVALWLRKTLFSIGKHTTRLPMALAGVSPGAAGHEVDAPHGVVRQTHATMGSAGRSVVKPLYPTPQSALSAKAAVSTGAKKAPTAVARKAATAKGATAASGATAGATVATAGGALVGYAAVRAGQAGVHAYEGLRRRTVSAVSGHLGHPIAPGEQTLRHADKDPGLGHAAWQFNRHRISRGGTKPLQGQRVKPLEPIHAGPPESVRTTTPKSKTK